MGHARAILGLATPELQTQVAEKAAAQGFSVRQVERLVKKVNEPREPSEEPLQDPNIKAAVGSAGGRARDTGPDRRKIGPARPDRNRILLAGRTPKDLRVDCFDGSAIRPSVNGAGGRSRTCDLRIMRPSL